MVVIVPIMAFLPDSAGDTIISGGGVQAGHSGLGHERAELPKLFLDWVFHEAGGGQCREEGDC
jgi:hypothetical protein